MSREAQYESLSAVMDGEADELELRRVLATFGDDAGFRATWSRYQLARAAMHKDLLEPRLDMASSVAVALSEGKPIAGTKEEMACLSKVWRFPWGMVGRVAIAASVTIAILAGVRLYNQSGIVGSEMVQQVAHPSLAVPQVQGTPVLAGYTESADQPQDPLPQNSEPEADKHEERLPAFIRQQAPRSTITGAENGSPDSR